MLNYDPQHWYWIVAGDESKIYSSAAAAYIEPDNAAYVAWKAQGNTASPILSEDELRDVLAVQYPDGWPAEALKIAAQDFLTKSDIVATRCFKAGVAFPPTWQSATVTARTILRTGIGVIPATPDYPANT